MVKNIVNMLMLMFTWVMCVYIYITVGALTVCEIGPEKINGRF